MALRTLKLDMWSRVLCLINENNGEMITTIFHKTECTYSHILDIIKLLKDSKLITTKVYGRTTKLYITKRGQVVAQHFYNINRLIK